MDMLQKCLRGQLNVLEVKTNNWPTHWTLIPENVTMCLVAKIKISQKEASFIGVICIVTQHSGKTCCVTTQATPAQETAFEFFQVN